MWPAAWARNPRAASSDGATFSKLPAAINSLIVSTPVGQLAMVGADCQLDQGALLGGAGERVLRVAPGRGAPKDHLTVVPDSAQRLDHRLGDVVAVRLTHDDDIDVVRERARLALVPRGPGAGDESLLYSRDAGERVLDDGLRPVAEEEQVCQRANERAGAGAQQSRAPSSAVGEDAGLDEALNF